MGVGATVASFVSTECPVGRGMWGIFGRPLEKGFSEMSRGGGGGEVRNHIFLKIARYC